MTPLSDQYALGVVLRECVTGKNPFEGSNFAEVVKLITNAQYPSLAELNPRLSKRFVAIVDRAMNVDPNNRFSDMRAMGRQLLLLAGQRTRITWGLTFGQEGRGPLPLATLERPSVPQQLPPAPPRKRRATAMLIAGVAVLSASLTSLFLTPDRDDATSVQAQAPSRESTSPTSTVVLPNAPNEPAPAARALLPPAPAQDEHRLNRNAQLDVPADDEPQAREEEAKPARSAPASEARKPQRTVQRKPAPAPRPAPPRRRPPPPRVDEDSEDWEVNVVSRVPSSKQNFEVGSNNAPILD
jgi:serine/threonine protein kinase